eukprot:4897785-Prymnesium_polylepis.1
MGVNTLRETNGTWDNGRDHAWTQVHAARSGHLGTFTADATRRIDVKTCKASCECISLPSHHGENACLQVGP